MTKISASKQSCLAPKTDFVGEANLLLSADGQKWQDVGSKVMFYNGPKVTAVSPNNGVTKNPRGLKMEISGLNFICPKSNGVDDCK